MCLPHCRAGKHLCHRLSTSFLCRIRKFVPGTGEVLTIGGATPGYADGETKTAEGQGFVCAVCMHEFRQQEIT